MTDIERRALLGDKKAQAECTANGIVLPCPCCGENGGRRHIAEGNHWYYCKECQVATRFCETIKEALAAWNTRPAPPIGRCGTCKFQMTKDCPAYSFDGDGYCTGGPGSDYFCANYVREEADHAD